MTRPVCTLLLVEDFSIDRELYRRCLRADPSYTYRFLEAESVREGLELCRTQAIDAILLDYVLPDNDGLAFLESLYAQSSGDRPPVIMMSGQGNEAIAVRAMKLGAEDYLVKDRLTPELLQLAVGNAIENARLRLQLRHSEERFRISLENLLDCFGIFVAIRDECGQITDFRIDYLNDAALRSTLLNRDDIGKGICELLPKIVEMGLFGAACRCVEMGEPLPTEWIYNDVFGNQRFVRSYELRASKLDDGLVVSWRDVTAQRQSELCLRASEDRWQLAINVNRAGIWEQDLRTDRVTVSDRLIEILGCAPNAITHFNQFLAYVHPEDIARMHATWQQHLNRETEIYSCEYRVRAADGGYKWVAARGQVLWDDLGNRLRAVGTLTDIDEVKHNEILVSQQLAEIESIYAMAPIGLCYVDCDLRFVRINERLAQMNGLPAAEHIGKSLREVLPEAAEVLEPVYRQVIRSGEPLLDWEVIGPSRTRPGTQGCCLVSLYPQQGADRRVMGVNVMVQDITDLKQRQADLQQTAAELQQSELRYRYLLEQIPQLVWSADADGNMSDVNDRWTAFTGLTAERARIAGWQEIVHPEDVATLFQAWQLAQQSGSQYQAEGRIRRQDGVYRWHLHQAMPQKDERGQIVKWFGTATDIEDLKQIEADRARLLVVAEAARAEAEAANHSKDEFIAIVAHELRSPLNSISGWAKLLQTRKFDEATQAKALDTIWRNTQTQVQLIEDLLDISRMVKGTLHLTLAPVNLGVVTQSAIDLVSPLAAAKHIEILTQLTSTLLIAGDSQRLQQVVVNLLTNAIKFTPENGSIEIELQNMDDLVRLRLTDTGKGIAPEFLPQIFDRFEQGQKNTGSKDGLGLGLAIVKNLVELHHGTIVAHSDGIGRGATFTVELPILGATSISPVLDSQIVTANN